MNHFTAPLPVRASELARRETRSKRSLARSEPSERAYCRSELARGSEREGSERAGGRAPAAPALVGGSARCCPAVARWAVGSAAATS